MEKQRRKIVQFLALILLAIISMTACTSHAKSVTEKIELGQKYLTELNYAEAVASFTEAIGLNPESIPAYMGRAQAYVGLKQYDDAKTDYTTVIEKTEEQPYTQAEAYIGRAEVNELTAENEKALSDYETAQSILDTIDWNRFKDVTVQMIQELHEKIEKACEKLRQILGLDENDEPVNKVEIFQNALDAVAADSKYTGCERYVVVNDYDGDGKQEAFGFFGIWSGENRNWQSLKLYYIRSDGQIEEIPTDENELGNPEKMSGTEQMDFSESFITLKGKTFLSFEVGYPESEPQCVLLGVNNGGYTQNYLYGYFPEKVDESHIATEDIDYRVVYQERNGAFVEVERMPGEEYQDRFASKDEYLNSMLSETQLKGLAADLGVPEALEVRCTQSERAYWEAGGCWEIYVEIDADKKVVAAASVDAETGELTRNILTYNESGYWEAE